MAMPGTLPLSPGMKIDISGVPFRVVGGSGDEEADVNQSTDTESLYGNHENASDGYTQAEVAFEAQLDTMVTNPTVAFAIDPLWIYPGTWVRLQIWPQGRDVDNSDWLMVIVIRRVVFRFNVSRSAIIGLSIMGVTSGYVKRPYEPLLADPADGLPPQVRRGE